MYPTRTITNVTSYVDEFLYYNTVVPVSYSLIVPECPRPPRKKTSGFNTDTSTASSIHAEKKRKQHRTATR